MQAYNMHFWIKREPPCNGWHLNYLRASPLKGFVENDSPEKRIGVAERQGIEGVSAFPEKYF
jgi:hypothetical protein